LIIFESKSHFDEENTVGYKFVNSDEPDEITIGLGRAFPGFDAGKNREKSHYFEKES
jgi:hypothetical protein